jgi:NDP-sugar pyrophosphorylase family protein
MSRPVSVRQAVIIAGHLGAPAPGTPKPAFPVGGRPFLAWLVRELSRYGVEEVLFLSGHLSQRQRAEVERFNAELPRPLELSFSEEPAAAGTGGGVWHARARLDERFLLCNGDSLFACNLATLFAAAATDPDDVLGRLVVRPLAAAGRFGIVSCDGDRVTAFHERPPPGTATALIGAGICLLDRRVLTRLRPAARSSATFSPRWPQKVGYVRPRVPATSSTSVFPTPTPVPRMNCRTPSAVRPCSSIATGC